MKGFRKVIGIEAKISRQLNVKEHRNLKLRLRFFLIVK